jgi:hypothetical protein
MDPNRVVLCNACKTSPATTFIQGTLEIIGHERYQVKCLNLALCDDCAAHADLVTDSGVHLAEVITGADRSHAEAVVGK